MQAVYNAGAVERAEKEDSFLQSFAYLRDKDKRRQRRMRKGHRFD